MKTIKTTVVLLFAVIALLFTAGCLAGSADELYSLPQLSEEYLQLQKLIDHELDTGSELAAPTAGSYRQSVQLCDLDSDGHDEALAFFRSQDQSLKICIYHSGGNGFALATTIQGEGSSIGGIEYTDMDGDGMSELLVSWQMSADFRMLSAYSLENWNGAVLLTADCTEFLVYDLDADGRSELLILSFDASAGSTVDLYRLGDDNEMTGLSAPLSAGLTSVDRMRIGTLNDRVSALFVESTYGDGLVLTDIFTCPGGSFQNITLDGSGVSTLRRGYPVYASDIDGDRCLEVPSAELLYSQAESSSSYWVFDWYDVSSDGSRRLERSTYHCGSDGWYFILPEHLRENLTVRREDHGAGERSVVLSTHDPATGQVEDFLTIYTLTGENRYDRAELGDRFILLDAKSTTYAAKLMSGAITREEAETGFMLIYTEWFTGAL